MTYNIEDLQDIKYNEERFWICDYRHKVTHTRPEYALSPTWAIYHFTPGVLSPTGFQYFNPISEATGAVLSKVIAVDRWYKTPKIFDTEAECIECFKLQAQKIFDDLDTYEKSEIKRLDKIRDKIKKLLS